MRSARERQSQAKQRHVGERIRRAAGRFREPRIALLGLSYKPNVDDLREKPCRCDRQRAHRRQSWRTLSGRTASSTSPPNGFASHPLVHWADLDADAIRKADIVAVLVAHDQFRRSTGRR